MSEFTQEVCMDGVEVYLPAVHNSRTDYLFGMINLHHDEAIRTESRRGIFHRLSKARGRTWPTEQDGRIWDIPFGREAIT